MVFDITLYFYVISLIDLHVFSAY